MYRALECFEYINNVQFIYREFFTLGNQQLWNQTQGHGAKQKDSSRLLHSSAPSQTDKVPPQITSPWLHDQLICYLRRNKWWKNQVLINICIWLSHTCSIVHKEITLKLMYYPYLINKLNTQMLIFFQKILVPFYHGLILSMFNEIIFWIFC